MEEQEDTRDAGVVRVNSEPFLSLMRFARNVLLVNMPVSDFPELSGGKDSKRCVTELSIDGECSETSHAEQNAPYDSVLFPIPSKDVEPLKRLFVRLGPLLGKHGMIYAFAETSGKDELGKYLCNLDAACKNAGLCRYSVVASDLENEAAGSVTFLIVSEDYDPVRHAVECFKSGKPPAALEILKNVPPDLLASSDEMRVRVASTKQLCLLAWGNTQSPRKKLFCFSHAQKEFYEAVHYEPGHREAYLYHSEFWHRIGNDDMAARILRSFDLVYPDQLVRQKLEQYEAGGQAAEFDDEAPIWTEGDSVKRVLVITHENSDCHMDIMYDGMCSLLGADNVVEYPWKPFLHGREYEKAGNYPCTFDLPGEDVSVGFLESELRQGNFDVVLYADMFHFNDEEPVRRLLSAAEGVPLFIVDTWDECSDSCKDNLEYLGRESVGGLFKREMLACHDYGEDAYPLPLAYPGNRIPQEISWDSRDGLFWAGNRRWAMRRLYLEWIEKKHGLELNTEYTPDEYSEALLGADIGLDFFGFGFGTMRYYELPAHGCMLLAPRPPIRIPHNFRDGESAVFYDDLRDLDEKIEYYLSHPDEVERIAKAGYEHLKNYHTGIKRAGQMLAWIERKLGDAGD